MKRVVLATALACVAMSASADVTVYGRVDTGLLYAHDAKGDVVSMESGIAGAARLGFKGTEKISDNLKVGFVLEASLKDDTGAAFEAGFDREAALYVYTPYGDLRIGRSGALGGGSNGGIFGGLVSPFGTVYKNAASTQIHVQEERFNNQVRYDSPVMGGLKLMAQYANGGANTKYDTATEKKVIDDDTSRQNRYAAVGASYKVGGLNMVAVYDRVYKKGDNNDAKYAKIGASYKVDNVTFFAGYQHAENAAVGKSKLKSADSDSVTFGTRVAVAGGDLNMGFGYAKGEKNGSEAEIVQAAVGYTFALSKRTTLYAAGTYLDTKYEAVTDAVDGSVKQVMAGLYHTF